MDMYWCSIGPTKRYDEVMFDDQKILGGRKFPLPYQPLLTTSDSNKSFRDRMYLPCWKYNEILLLEGSKLIQAITYPTFSHVHTTEWIQDVQNPHESNLLISSSGTDLVTEVSTGGEIKSEWWAFEHGFTKTKRGDTIENFDKEYDYRHQWAPTARQTTHVNCALPYDKNSWLSTLPVVGKLVLIDRISGNSRVILENLAFPHSVRRRHNNKGFLLSNTLANEVIFLTNDLQKDKVVKFNLKLTWIQDTIELANGNLIVVTNRKLPLSEDFGPEDPSDSNYIVETDSEGNLISTVDGDRENRLYSMEILSQEEAEYWAAAFMKDSTSTKTMDELSCFKWLQNSDAIKL